MLRAGSLMPTNPTARLQTAEATAKRVPVRVPVRDRGRWKRSAILLAGLLLLGTVSAVSLFIGAGDVAPAQVLATLGGSGSGSGSGTGTAETMTIVHEMRIPRTLTAILVGAALGVAGAVMQLLVRNPLADPGLLGVNAGAGLAVVLAAGAIGMVDFDRYVWFAVGGAFLVSLLVYAIGISAARSSPATIVLAGIAITAVLTGISTALALLDPGKFNVLRGWMAGNVAGRDIETVAQGAILIGAGMLVAFGAARSLGQLGLGDDIARSLGVHVGATRVAAVVAVMLLAGVGTALAGPILFVGLMVPHLARALVGPRAGWGFALSAVAGAMLLLIADMIGRSLIPPGEAPAGLLTAIIGAPVLALLARRPTGAQQ